MQGQTPHTGLCYVVYVAYVPYVAYVIYVIYVTDVTDNSDITDNSDKNFLVHFFCDFFWWFKKKLYLCNAFGENGRLAQLVQSVCLTSRGSGVRIPQRPLFSLLFSHSA